MDTCWMRSVGMPLAGAILFCTTALSQQSATPPKGQAPPVLGLKIEHITFSVADLDRESAWLEQVFDFKVSHEGSGPDSRSRSLTIPGFRIDLTERKGSSRPPLTDPRDLQQGFMHVVFQVPDLRAAYKQLQDLKQDVMLEVEPKKELWGLRFHDPDGNEFELTQYGHEY